MNLPLALLLAAVPLHAALSYTITSLGGSATNAYSINSLGHVTGVASTPTGAHAFLYANGTITDLGAPNANSRAYGVNSAGSVVGYSQAPDGSYHAFLYENGAFTTLAPSLAPQTPGTSGSPSTTLVRSPAGRI